MSPVAPRQYELIYIVTPDASDQDVASVHAEVKASWRGSTVKLRTPSNGESAGSPT